MLSENSVLVAPELCSPHDDVRAHDEHEHRGALGRGAALEDEAAHGALVQQQTHAREGGGHPHVVGSYFHFQEDERLYLVNEYCGGGDLHSHIIAASPTHSVDERTSVRIMRQIIEGVDYLHRQLGIAHRDLSLENVLVHEGECKIADFGSSVDATARCTGRAGKAYYMAPEVVAGVEYDPVKADIWSLGIVWFVMLTGSPLVSVASEQNKAFVSFKRCGVADVFTSWGHNDRLSAAVINVVSRMLAVSPEERISLAEVMAHPIMGGVDP